MSFDIALSGIKGIDDQLRSISNNIANTMTVGFKSARSNFAAAYAGAQPNGVYVGSVQQMMDVSGSLQKTGRAMDAAIQGRGFFVTRDTSGATLYTRAGIFDRDRDGYIVDALHHRVQGYGDAGFGDLKVPTSDLPGQASTRLDYVGHLSAEWDSKNPAKFDAADATTYNTTVVSTLYDSLGRKHEVTQYFIKTGDNTVALRYSMDGKPPAASQTATLAFDTSGRLTSPTQAVSLDFGKPTGAADLKVAFGYSGTTYSGGAYSTTTNGTDGYASGSAQGVTLEEDGSVEVQYSNGQKKSVGTVAIAAFADEGALQAVDGTCWKETSASGQPMYGMPGAGMNGRLMVSALEQSNVDQTGELVSLTTAERNYQANSKVISTENQMMQALMQAV